MPRNEAVVCTESWTLLDDFIRSLLLLLTQQTDERAREIAAAFDSISRANRPPELEDCSPLEVTGTLLVNTPQPFHRWPSNWRRKEDARAKPAARKNSRRGWSRRFVIKQRDLLYDAATRRPRGLAGEKKRPGFRSGSHEAETVSRSTSTRKERSERA